MSSQNKHSADASISNQAPRRRGRPRKNPLPGMNTEQHRQDSSELPVPVRRRRGRPPKADSKYPTIADMKSFKRKWSMIEMMIHRDKDHQDGWTVEEFSQHFNVTARTIRRDLKILDDIFNGLDIKRVRWGLKRYYLERIPFGENGAAITRDELVSLCIARQMMMPFQGTPLGNDIESGYQKLRDCLSKEWIDRADKIASYFCQFEYNTPLSENQTKFLDLLFQAMKDCKVVEFEYFSVKSQETKQYQVQPYCFIYDKGFIYLLGLNCMTGRFQHWKLTRFKDVSVLDKNFKRSETFDVEHYADNAINMFITEDSPRRIRVRFSPTTAQSIKELGLSVIRKKRTRKDGSLEVEMYVDVTPALVSWFISLGDGAEVIFPRDLREDISIEASKLVRLYR